MLNFFRSYCIRLTNYSESWEEKSFHLVKNLELYLEVAGSIPVRIFLPFMF